MKQNIGCWSDLITKGEVNFSQSSVALLIEAQWAGRMFAKNGKIQKARDDVASPNPHISYSEMDNIKSALFEVRAAYAIHSLGFGVDYEVKADVGESRVDFKAKNPLNDAIFLIEAASARDSENIKKNTTIDGDISFLNLGGHEESDEMIRIQNILLSKVTDDSMKTHIDPIKFPNFSHKHFHIILVDARAWRSDIVDHMHVLYGHNILRGLTDAGIPAEALYGRKKAGVPIKGVFEPDHPNPRSQYIRERIHAIGFIREKDYVEDEILDKTKLFLNPKFWDPSKKFVPTYTLRKFLSSYSQ